MYTTIKILPQDKSSPRRMGRPRTNTEDGNEQSSIATTSKAPPSAPPTNIDPPQASQPITTRVSEETHNSPVQVDDDSPAQPPLTTDTPPQPSIENTTPATIISTDPPSTASGSGQTPPPSRLQDRIAAYAKANSSNGNQDIRSMFSPATNTEAQKKIVSDTAAKLGLAVWEHDIWFGKSIIKTTPEQGVHRRNDCPGCQDKITPGTLEISLRCGHPFHDICIIKFAKNKITRAHGDEDNPDHETEHWRCPTCNVCLDNMPNGYTRGLLTQRR